MQFTIEVNNKTIKAEKGETILSALNRNGIIIPTLCRMAEFSPTGACRMCVVEVEGRERLVTACSSPVEEWMKIKTHSPRVIRARKTIVELLLSNHPDDCLYCDRNLDCELQRLSDEMQVRERRIHGSKIKPRRDQSSPAIVRELSKCILCGRCLRVCEEVVTATAIDFIGRGRYTHVGPAMDRDFNFSSCIHCGQCVLVCPTGALHEKHYLSEVQEQLSKSDVTRVIQYSPIVPYALAEELGVKYNRDFDRLLNAALRKAGFDKVFLSGTGTDILITELTDAIIQGRKKTDNTPLIVSACPAWVKYCEQFTPELMPMLSTLKTPQQISGAIIKSVVPVSDNKSHVYTVSVTPCTAMKFEARRDSMTRKGISDIDTVLTVRELARLIILYGVDIANIDPEQADEPMALRSSASLLAESAGGITESVLRSLAVRAGKKEADRQVVKKLRNPGVFREAMITAGGVNYSVAVVDGMKGLEKLKQMLDSGSSYDLVEVMACPGGCVNGGGMMPAGSREAVRQRSRFIWQTNDQEAVRGPEQSASVADLYGKVFKQCEELVDRKMFHTHFTKREVLL
ncbi:MAG: [Fe-Fe] hydrogenase large subunit C-terminal domain-containing protein [Bacteroidales bacterium]|jgi:iron-only hydrogenase group A|nr:[Fe-Fe] hydrogenase large subunit C-terminal domain-containing protein [Bacteroidales bacterium]